MDQHTVQNRIRLVLLDEHCLFRASLSRFLASEDGFQIDGEYGTFTEALEALNSSTADVVLLEFDLGSASGNDFISAARQAGYCGRFLLLTGAVDARSAAMALKLGAGIFLKSETPERLVYAIRLVADGQVWVDPRVIQMLAEQLINYCPRYEGQKSSGFLEERERNVLLGILGGLTNKRIGNKLGLTETSVKHLVRRLFTKAGVKKRSQLVRAALEGSLGATRQFIRQQSERTPHRDLPAPNETRPHTINRWPVR